LGAEDEASRDNTVCAAPRMPVDVEGSDGFSREEGDWLRTESTVCTAPGGGAFGGGAVGGGAVRSGPWGGVDMLGCGVLIGRGGSGTKCRKKRRPGSSVFSGAKRRTGYGPARQTAVMEPGRECT
jgi:hypothetical protein